jgi:hypothetical protein
MVECPHTVRASPKAANRLKPRNSVAPGRPQEWSIALRLRRCADKNLHCRRFHALPMQGAEASHSRRNQGNRESSSRLLSIARRPSGVRQVRVTTSRSKPNGSPFCEKCTEPCHPAIFRRTCGRSFLNKWVSSDWCTLVRLGRASAHSKTLRSLGRQAAFSSELALPGPSKQEERIENTSPAAHS